MLLNIVRHYLGHWSLSPFFFTRYIQLGEEVEVSPFGCQGHLRETTIPVTEWQILNRL